MVNSGSSANLLAISALCSPHTNKRLKPGDEVIVPSYHGQLQSGL